MLNWFSSQIIVKLFDNSLYTYFQLKNIHLSHNNIQNYFAAVNEHNLKNNRNLPSTENHDSNGFWSKNILKAW